MFFHGTLDGCRQVNEQMKSVCDLDCSGRTIRCAFGIQSTSITADNFNRRMLPQPTFKRFSRPVGKQVHHPMSLEINQYGSVILPLAPRPVVHAQLSKYIGLWLRVSSAFECSQNGIVTDRHGKTFHNATPRPPASRIANQMDDVQHARRPTRITAHYRRNAFREDVFTAQLIAAPESPNLQPEFDRCALPRQVLQPAKVVAVHRSRMCAAFRTTVRL